MSAMRGWLVGMSVVSSVLLPITAAAQDEVSRVVLEEPTCEDLPFDWESFASLLALELADDGVAEIVGPTEDPSSPLGEQTLAIIRVLTSCSRAELSADVVRVEIEDRLTQKQVTRDFDLTGVPLRSRSRALALGAAELLRASWAELAMPSAPSPIVDVPPTIRDAVRVVPRRPLTDPFPPTAPAAERRDASTATVEPAPERTTHLTLRAVLEVDAFASGNLALGGGALEGDIVLDSVVALRLGVRSGYGQSSHPLGEVEVIAMLGQLGISFGTQLSDLWLSLTPAIELGWGRASGRTGRADVTVAAGEAALLLACVDLEASFAVSEPLDLYAALGVGYAILGLRATAMDAAFSGITGPSVNVALGLALRVD